MDVENKGKEPILIIEECTLKLKMLIQKSIKDVVSLEATKEEAKQLIKQAYDDILSIGKDYKELAQNTLKGLNSRFNEWYRKALNKLKSSRNPISLLLLSYIKNNPHQTSFTIGNKENVNTQLMTAEELREHLTSGKSGYSQMIIEEYTNDIKSAMYDVIERRPTLKDKNGRNLSLRNLAELQVRYDTTKKELSTLKDKGVKYVIASQHFDCSERCQPFQGKIFVLDVDPKTEFKKPIIIKGFKPTPQGRIGNESYYSLREAMEHGFLSYNCRHRLVKYEKGMYKPKPINANEIKREREADKNQRSFERQIRHAKEMQVLDKDNRKEWINKSKDLMDKYKAYSKKMNRTYYPWRCSLTLNERQIKLI